jgi:hypothetical protein
MAISSTTRKSGSYIGNGATVEFPFGFKVFLPSQLLLVRADLLGGNTKLIWLLCAAALSRCASTALIAPPPMAVQCSALPLPAAWLTAPPGESLKAWHKMFSTYALPSSATPPKSNDFKVTYALSPLSR